MKIKHLFSGLLTVAILLSATALSAQTTVKNGDKIAFLGDSITQQGNGPAGYVNLVMDALNANGIKAVKIPAGISGHKSNNMLERLDRDVLKKKPQHMTLSCGVNDVWHGKRGVPLDQYKKNITQIVDKAQAAGIKVYILTSTMITENAKNPANIKLAGYNDFLRQLAKEKNCVLVDLNKNMQDQIAAIKKKYPKFKSGNALTHDGVHMNPMGNIMMAEGVLKGFGLTDAQIAKASAKWMNSAWTYRGFITFKVKDYIKFSEKAFAEGKDVSAMIRDIVTREINK